MENKQIQEFSGKESRLVDAILSGKPLKVCATLTGISLKDAENIVQRKHIRNIVSEKLNALLQTEDAPMARKVLISIARNKKMPAKLRIDCAKDLLDRAGYTPPKRAEQKLPSGKSLSELTGDELRQAIGQLSGELNSRARNAKIIDAQAVDISQ